MPGENLLIDCQIVPSVEPSDRAPAEVARSFRRSIDRGEISLRVVGEAAADPLRLFRLGFAPHHEIELFGVKFLLADVRQNEEIRFFVAYVVKGRRAWARLFYKDVSLVWRSASHIVSNEEETWIGKGDLAWSVVDGEELPFSDEATTDLPLELQAAIESLVKRAPRMRTDRTGPKLVLRAGGPSRIAPFSDFSNPRRRAQADPTNLVNGGRPVARFTRKNDPGSLKFARGYEPDFVDGVVERSAFGSKVYGGRVRRFRILSKNKKIQYGFLTGRWHSWIIPPQATTTQLSSFGLRTIDVKADDDLFVPGWEYHFHDGEAWVSQIPPGYVGRPNPDEPTRSDTSAWLDALPVIQEFRSVVLGRGR